MQDVDFQIGNAEDKIKALGISKITLLQTLDYLKGNKQNGEAYPFIFSIKLETHFFGQPGRENNREILLSGLSIALDEQFIVGTIAKIDGLINDKRNELSALYDLKISQLQERKKKL